MSNCHLVAGRSLIDLVASRLALLGGAAAAWPVAARGRKRASKCAALAC